MDKKWLFGEMKYRGINCLNHVDVFSKQDCIYFLYKDKELEYKKEYRLVTDKSIESAITIEIGEIKDSSIVMEVENLEKGLKLDINFKK